MMTLEKILSSNLDMLKNQETELQKSLDFVQKAIELFNSHGGSTVQEKKGGTAAIVPSQPVTNTKSIKITGAGEGTFIDKVINILKQKNGQASGDIIQTLFSGQTKEKNRVKFAQNIYVNLGQAKKKGRLKFRDGKYYLS